MFQGGHHQWTCHMTSSFTTEHHCSEWVIVKIGRRIKWRVLIFIQAPCAVFLFSFFLTPLKPLPIMRCVQRPPCFTHISNPSADWPHRVVNISDSWTTHYTIQLWTHKHRGGLCVPQTGLLTSKQTVILFEHQ